MNKSVLCLRLEYANDEQLPTLYSRQDILGGTLTAISWVDIFDKTDEELDRLRDENAKLKAKLTQIQHDIKAFLLQAIATEQNFCSTRSRGDRPQSEGSAQ